MFRKQRPVSLLLQGDNLFPHLSLLENVCLVAKPSFRLPEAVKQQASQALAEVGLADLTDQYPNTVSGGQAQRAGLARAILGHRLTPRPILLLDEPYSALDEDNFEHIHTLLQKLCQQEGLCVLLVAHRTLQAERIIIL